MTVLWIHSALRETLTTSIVWLWNRFTTTLGTSLLYIWSWAWFSLQNNQSVNLAKDFCLHPLPSLSQHWITSAHSLWPMPFGCKSANMFPISHCVVRFYEWCSCKELKFSIQNKTPFRPSCLAHSSLDPFLLWRMLFEHLSVFLGTDFRFLQSFSSASWCLGPGASHYFVARWIWAIACLMT